MPNDGSKNKSRSTSVIPLQQVVIKAQDHFDQEGVHRSYRVNRLKQEDFLSSGATDVKAALQDLPGINVKDLGGFIKQLQVRGLSGERVVTVVDGFKVSNQGLTHTGGGESNLIDMSTIETLDVVMGSPAVLYDPGATGGTIAIKTKGLRSDPHVSFEPILQYDSGYDKRRGSASTSMSSGPFSLLFNVAKTDSRNYRVKDEKKMDYWIAKINAQQELTGTTREINALSYEDESKSLKLGYTFPDTTQVSIGGSDYEAEDIFFTHQGYEPVIFVYDLYKKSEQRLTFERENLAGINKPKLALDRSSITKGVRTSADTRVVKLKSDAILFRGESFLDHGILSYGLEGRLDEAETAVHSQQDYLSGHLNWSIPWNHFDFNVGIRANYWKSEHSLKPWQDRDIAEQLVGLAGVIDERPSTFRPTYAFGVAWDLGHRGLLSLNASSTYREATLYERYAFDAFQGDPELEGESSKNIELGYRIHRGSQEFSVVGFANYFDHYIAARTIKTINQSLLSDFQQAVSDGFMTEEDLFDREFEYLSTIYKMTNYENVRNMGYELRYSIHWHELNRLSLNTSLNRFFSNNDLLQSEGNPMEFGATYRRTIKSCWPSSWIEARGRYVTDSPTVLQQGGFSEFVVCDLVGGVQSDKWNFNIGVRNLTNTVYNEAYLAIDGLERSVFMSFRLKLEHSLSPTLK